MYYKSGPNVENDMWFGTKLFEISTSQQKQSKTEILNINS